MQTTLTDRDAAVAARAALKELYLVSGAAAQLGACGLLVQDVQWQALVRASHTARAVLGARTDGEGEAAAAFRRLAALCDDLLDRRAMGHACPSSIWRDLARAGSDAYERLDG